MRTCARESVRLRGCAHCLGRRLCRLARRAQTTLARVDQRLIALPARVDLPLGRVEAALDLYTEVPAS
jgi:hypothetical protein